MGMGAESGLESNGRNEERKKKNILPAARGENMWKEADVGRWEVAVSGRKWASLTGCVFWGQEKTKHLFRLGA